MELAEAVCARSGSRAAADRGETREGEVPVFEVMANVVWSEIGRALMDELGSVIFAAGKPDEFRRVRALRLEGVGRMRFGLTLTLRSF